MKKCGKIIDVINKKIFNGCLIIEDGQIKEVIPVEEEFNDYILPGFIDSHVHIESSMLIPSRFAGLAVRQGTIAVVNDPHEISNVLDTEGFYFMIEDSKRVNFKFYFGVPSCVPATELETSGGKIDSEKVEKLLKEERVVVLSEMMNYPGVILGDSEVLKKIDAAKKVGKPIDGHAPGLRGKDLDKYIGAGISTDHEAYSYEEGKEKIEKGMYILVREGSAAKNFDSLHRLIDEYPDKVMLCTDDSHPDTLLNGHINKIIAKGLKKGNDLFNLLRAATLVPKEFYKLDIGLLQPGDSADFIIVESLEEMSVKETYINGECVFDGKTSKYGTPEYEAKNKFSAKKISSEDLKVIAATNKFQAIKCYDGELITDKIILDTTAGTVIDANEYENLNKILVLNRYNGVSKPSVGFIYGFDLEKGAIAMSIAHDSHNIIAVGKDDKDLVKATNKLIELKGGIVIFDGEDYHVLKLEVGGLMTGKDPLELAEKYKEIENTAKKLGTKLKAPLMTLSFMALLVIPKLKISDKGLFDGENFKFTEIFI